MLLQDVENMVKSHKGGEFNPCAFVDGLGSLIVVNRDCSQTHKPIPGTNIDLILDTHSDKVVGVAIHKWNGYIKKL